MPLFTTVCDRGSAGGGTVQATTATSAGLAAPAPLPAISAPIARAGVDPAAATTNAPTAALTPADHRA